MAKPIRQPWEGTMTPRERFNRQMHWQSVDRSVNMEFGYWQENYDTWKMFTDNGITNEWEANQFFSFDPIHGVGGNIWMCPPFEEKIIEERENTVIMQNGDGLLAEAAKDHSTIPHYMKSSIETPEDWEKVKR